MCHEMRATMLGLCTLSRIVVHTYSGGLACVGGIKNDIIIRLLHTKLDENTEILRWKVIRIFGKNNFSNMGLSHSDMRR